MSGRGLTPAVRQRVTGEAGPVAALARSGWPRGGQALLELAAEYSLLIIEDDPYGELFYESERAHLLAALDVALHGELRHVVYLSTFSKLLAPGLRVDWMVAPAGLARRLVEAKQGLDLHTSSLAQVVIYEACRDGLLDAHIPRLRQTYGARRDTMLRALQMQMPPGTRWTTPRGGMFVWLTLAPPLDTARLLGPARQRQVAFVPGAAFYAHGGGSQALRLNFSHAPPERIEEGIHRLRWAMDVAGPTGGPDGE